MSVLRIRDHEYPASNSCVTPRIFSWHLSPQNDAQSEVKGRACDLSLHDGCYFLPTETASAKFSNIIIVFFSSISINIP